MSRPAQSWQQPRPASGWGRTLRRWGSQLAPVAPFALGLLIPAPAAVVAAGTILIGGSATVLAGMTRDQWRDFEPEPGEHWDPDADELPEPGLLDALGLNGLRVEGVLRGGSDQDRWLVFQTIDRLGGRCTWLMLGLPNPATVPVRMTARRTRRSDAAALLTGDPFGRFKLARGIRSPDLRYRLSSEPMRAALAQPQVAAWSVHGTYLVAELHTVGRAALRVYLRLSLRWLLRLRDALPATLVRPAERPAATEDDAEWPLMAQGEPIEEQERPFIPKPSRQKYRRARPPRSP